MESLTKLPPFIPPRYEIQPFALAGLAFDALPATSREFLASLHSPSTLPDDIDRARARIVADLADALLENNTALLTLRYRVALSSDGCSDGQRDVTDVLLPQRENIMGDFVACFDALMWAQHECAPGEWTWIEIEVCRNDVLADICRNEEDKLVALDAETKAKIAKEKHKQRSRALPSLAHIQHPASSLGLVGDSPEDRDEDFSPQAQGTPKIKAGTLEGIADPARAGSPAISDVGLEFTDTTPLSQSPDASTRVASDDEEDEDERPDSRASAQPTLQESPGPCQVWGWTTHIPPLNDKCGPEPFPRLTPGYNWPYPFLYPQAYPEHIGRHTKKRRPTDKRLFLQLKSESDDLQAGAPAIPQEVGSVQPRLGETMPWDFDAAGRRRATTFKVANERKTVVDLRRPAYRSCGWKPNTFQESECDSSLEEPMLRRTLSQYDLILDEMMRQAMSEQ